MLRATPPRFAWTIRIPNDEADSYPKFPPLPLTLLSSLYHARGFLSTSTSLASSDPSGGVTS